MLEIIGLIIGVAVGMFVPVYIPSSLSLYMATGLLAAVDSALGGCNARIRGNFRLSIFLSGTIGNALMAVFMTWLGEKLGLPLYLAVVIVFGMRTFQNFAEIRRELLTLRQKKDRIEDNK